MAIRERSPMESLIKVVNALQVVGSGMDYAALIAVSIYWTKFVFNHGLKDTTLHAYLTVIGFHVLGSVAIMVHYPHNILTRKMRYRTKTKIHAVLQIIGGSMVLFGAFSKIFSTEVHFQTWHGLFGLSATFMCFASMCGGFLNYFQPNFIKKIYSPSQLKWRHNLFGIFTYLLGARAIFLGYQTKFWIKYEQEHMVEALSGLLIYIVVLSLLGPVYSIYKKFRYILAH